MDGILEIFPQFANLRYASGNDTYGLVFGFNPFGSEVCVKEVAQAV